MRVDNPSASSRGMPPLKSDNEKKFSCVITLPFALNTQTTAMSILQSVNRNPQISGVECLQFAALRRHWRTIVELLDSARAYNTSYCSSSAPGFFLPITDNSWPPNNCVIGCSDNLRTNSNSPEWKSFCPTSSLQTAIRCGRLLVRCYD